MCRTVDLIGQDVKAVHRDHAWDAPVWRTEWNDPAALSEVLHDDLAIRFRNVKPQFLSVFFERTTILRFATEEDILAHSRIILPESLDPAYDGRFLPWSDQDRPVGPMWFNVRLDEFAARIIRADGTWGEVGVFSRIHREQVRTVRSMEVAWSYILDLQAIQPGDVIEVHWKYMIPYDNNWESTQGWRAFEWLDNWSRLTNWRVFFHGELPIREQQVSLKYHVKHGVVLGGEPPASRNEDGGYVLALWKHKDLPGSMGEVNSRPGADLPYITVLLAPEDFRYWRRDRLSGVSHEQPFWLQVLRKREERAFFWLQVSKKNLPDHQNQLLKNYVERVADPRNGLAPGERMELLHEDIAEHFEYEDDQLWYLDKDRGLARIGDQVDDGRIREISRYDLYAKLACRVGAPYTTGYLMDKRIGTMDENWMTPLWDSEFLMGVRTASGMSWMHPKRSRTGTFANELPFYWRGSKVLTMDLGQLLADFPSAPIFKDLPTYDDFVDIRTTKYDLELDATRNDAEGNASVLLSGQFSTLGRAAYLDQTLDPTVDPLYGSKAFGRGPIEVIGVPDHELSSDPPFEFRGKASVRVKEMMEVADDGSRYVDLSPFFRHVVPVGFDPALRDLPFYWDLAQDDQVVLDLHFDEPMRILNEDEVERTAYTPQAQFTRSIEQVTPSTIRVTSRLIIMGEREEVSDAKAVAALIDAIRSRPARVQVMPTADQ